MVSGRSHLSIGEVLSLVQSDFPEVTISKIRFLEAQGLLEPERTPSGYRKFYDADVRRLRWILTEQRDRFLPLRVIKDRLTEGLDIDTEQPSTNAAHGRAGTGDSPSAATADGSPETALEQSEVAMATNAGTAQGDGEQEGEGTESESSTPADSGSSPAGDESNSSATAPPIWMADAARTRPAERAAAPTSAEVVALMSDPTTVSLTADELMAAAGLSRAQVESLEEFGLLSGHDVGRDRFYGGDDLVIAQKAAGFLARGLEARHLRTFKTAAEREASLIEQLVLPLVKQRNADGRDQASTAMAELATLGQSLRAALLRAALRDAHLL